MNTNPLMKKMVGMCMAWTALAIVMGAGCGQEDPYGQDLCALCQTPGGACEQGCCDYPEDPVALCQAYTQALCDRLLACTPAGTTRDDIWFCDADCSQMNACERIMLSAYPEDLLACQGSLAEAACDPDGSASLVETPECLAWQAKAESAVEDSSCHDSANDREGSGGTTRAASAPGY